MKNVNPIVENIIILCGWGGLGAGVIVIAVVGDGVDLYGVILGSVICLIGLFMVISKRFKYFVSRFAIFCRANDDELL